MKTLKTILVMGLLLMPSAIWAQLFQVEGQVMNTNKEILEGATVILYMNDSIESAAITDKKGAFRVERLAKGNYLLQISSLGYKPYEKELAVSANLSLGKVQLEEDAKLMDEVTVSADKRDLITTEGGSTTFHLSEKARNSAHNTYEALREIPVLMVNPINRTIQLNDGSTPLILINGVARPGMINSLDPKDIEAIEVVEEASARYRATGGVTTILNLKVKRKKQLAASANVFTRHNPELIFGFTGGSLDMGNSKVSLYLNAYHSYSNKNKRLQESRVQSGTMTREWEGEGVNDGSNLSLSLGGDWVASSRDYFAFAIEHQSSPSEYSNQLRGYVEDGAASSASQSEQFVKNTNFTNVYSLFYKRTFNKDRHLEATAKFGWFGSDNMGWRKENSELYAYNTLIDMDNDKKSLTFDLNYDFRLPEKFSFNVGSNTYWQQNEIENKVDAFPPFIFKGLNEYVYADMRSLTKSKFSYMLSVGVDMVFNSSDGVKHSYVNVVPSMALTYNFNKSNTLRFTASRDRVSPTVGSLNPRNTSTDSLRVITGNPYLEPYISNKFRLSYQWKPKGFYLEPYVQYTLIEDYVQSVNKVEGVIRTTTYENLDNLGRFVAGLTTRVNFGEWGSLSNHIFYNKRIDDKSNFSGNYWGGNVDLYLSYKNVSLDATVNYNLRSYGRTTKRSNSPYTEVTLAWRLSKGWMLMASMREFGKSWNETLGKDVNYSSYSKTYNADRNNLIMVGFSYYIRNKVNNPNRSKKRLRNSDSGIGVTIQ